MFSVHSIYFYFIVWIFYGRNKAIYEKKVGIGAAQTKVARFSYPYEEITRGEVFCRIEV